MTKNPTPRHSELETLQRRVGYRIAAALTSQTHALPHDIGERLRVAREQALNHARQARQAAAATVTLGMSGNAATLGGPSPWWLRLASFSPLVVLVGGLVMIQHWHDQNQINAAAEVDAALLADDLPPNAYGDPGFGEYLKQRLK